MKLLRSGDLIPLAVIVPMGAFALLIGYVAISVASRAFDGGYHDNNDSAYLLFGGFMFLLAAIPDTFALLIAKAAGWRVLLVALPIAAVLAVLAQLLIADLSRRGADNHIRERQRDTSISPVASSPPLTPPATPSLGAPRREKL